MTNLERGAVILSVKHSKNSAGFLINTPGGVPERPKGADCKSAVTDFEGSNPSPTTILV